MTYFKVTNSDGSPCNGGSGKWDLPTLRPDGTWRPGKWRTVTGDLVACENGLHLATPTTLIEWIGPAIWQAEVSGPVIDFGDKVVARRVRLVRGYPEWNERTARIFAVECAEDVLHLADPDSRPTLEVALYVARCYADGAATDKELAAARDAAFPAAWNAAGAAARDAAGAAAGAAARDAARDAAGAAARDAAGNAAVAAARDAAWAAARAAAGNAQSKRLMALLGVEA